MKILKLLFLIWVAIISILPFASLYADTPADVTEITANPSDTSIILTWVRSANSTQTLIRYRTDTYPTGTSDGTRVYFSTGWQTTVGNNTTGEHVAGDNTSALTPGQVYYFSIWGESSGNYSASAYHLAMSTLAVAIPTGAQDTTTVDLPTATLPPQMTQSPTSGAFQLEPFTSIITYFVSGEGGLGMPVNNVWETIAIVGIVIGGFGTYIKIRNFFVAFAVVFVLTLFAIGLSLVQGWLLGIEIVIGAGVWGVEHYLQ